MEHTLMTNGRGLETSNFITRQCCLRKDSDLTLVYSKDYLDLGFQRTWR